MYIFKKKYITLARSVLLITNCTIAIYKLNYEIIKHLQKLELADIPSKVLTP